MKQEFNLVTSGLVAYVDESSTDLLINLQAASSLAQHADIMSGVKGTVDMHFIDTTVTLQGDSCSYNASDATTLTKKPITVGAVAVMENICVKLLNGFWTQVLVKAGANNEDVIPQEIASKWMEIKLNKLKTIINKADWFGDTGSGTANLNKYNGLLKQIDADITVKHGNTGSVTVVDLTNVLAVMQAMYLVIPEDMRADNPDGENLEWFLPQAIYDLYIIAARNANLYHWNVQEGFATYHGTNITLVPQSGLGGSQRMIITPKGNIVIAMDGDSDEDVIDVWYSKDLQINLSKIAFKRGISYKFGESIVEFTPAAS